ncbi:MAG: M14-type cytosolic carboxypeptidase [Marinifilaceae bacterium]|jgi:murein tripeptide amidase MpaA|nr:M14-type cytosolic carboxypeptidase [Marinifilaceae bacterium]
MKISSNFDSGNIEIVNIVDNVIELKIPKDTKSDFFQWFHFRLTGAEYEEVEIRIVNAGESSYPEGWENYQCRASYDKKEWFTVETSYENGQLVINACPQLNSIYFAYFAPFSFEMHQELVSEAQLSEQCDLEVVGQTVEGRDIEMLTIGNADDDKKKIWVTARQHPGEAMAEWFVKGFIERILDEADPVARKILEEAVVYVVPNMNIDGSIAGNLRANAAGRNLNREWENPSEEFSPEVYYVRNKMDELGVDLALDIHGDEAIPYNFVTTPEGIPSFDEYRKNIQDKFKDHWMEISPDFQDTHNYGVSTAPANLAIGSKQIAERFKCVAFTIEMPFKDNDDMPDPVYAWSDDRAIKFGESVLNPILNVLKHLR